MGRGSCLLSLGHKSQLSLSPVQVDAVSFLSGAAWLIPGNRTVHGRGFGQEAAIFMCLLAPYPASKMVLIVPPGNIKHPGHLSSVGSPWGDRLGRGNPQSSLIESVCSSHCEDAVSIVCWPWRSHWKTFDFFPGWQSDEAIFELLDVEVAVGFLLPAPG